MIGYSFVSKNGYYLKFSKLSIRRKSDLKKKLRKQVFLKYNTYISILIRIKGKEDTIRKFTFSEPRKSTIIKECEYLKMEKASNNRSSKKKLASEVLTTKASLNP